MKYVQSMGYVWQLSEKKYEKLVKDLAAGKEVNLDGSGKWLGELVNLRDLEQRHCPK